MTELSRENIYQEIGNIVSKFKNLECDICAKAVMQLEGNRINESGKEKQRQKIAEEVR